MVIYFFMDVISTPTLKDVEDIGSRGKQSGALTELATWIRDDRWQVLGMPDKCNDKVQSSP